MFSEKLKDWIKSYVKYDYHGDIDRDIELFEKALSLSVPDYRLEGINVKLPSVLEEMSNSPSLDYTIERIDKLVKVEPFLRHLLGVLYPERFEIAPRDEKHGMNAFEWTFAPLLKQAFRIIPENYNIATRKPENISFEYKEFYDLIYTTRNNSAHDYVNMHQREAFEIITACLMVYLDVSSRLSDEIEEKFSKESIDTGFLAEKYCLDIINDYKLKAESGFTYIDVKWKATGRNAAEYSTVDTIMNDSSNRLVKLLGEAGCGKTTIMQQFEYLTAKNYLEKNSQVIPVLIPLGELETNSSLQHSINDMVCHKLKISPQLLEEMLSANTLRLYLDGFNEILNPQSRKYVAWSIDGLVKKYPNLVIFMTDRALLRQSIDALRGALVYRLYPLDNTMKEMFIRYNCSDEKVKNMLLDYFQSNPRQYENYGTPIKLMQLIELSIHQKQIPFNFDEEYIQFLFEREMVEKKDENVEYLEPFACALAISGIDKLTEYKAEAVIADCKRILGYTAPDSRTCLRLLIEMGILVLEDGYIEFKYQSYRDYFWMKAFETHLEELLEVNQ